MRWDTKVKCPKCKHGKLEAYEAEPDGESKRVQHGFICSNCDYQGYWRWFAKQRMGRR